MNTLSRRCPRNCADSPSAYCMPPLPFMPYDSSKRIAEPDYSFMAVLGERNRVGRRLLIARGRITRELNGESGALAKTRLDCDLAVVRSGQVLDYRQSQASPAKLTRASAINSVESFKQTIEVVRRDSFTSILDSNFVANSALIPDLDHAAVPIEFDCA